MSRVLKLAFGILLFCSLAFGQGAVISGGMRISGGTVLSPGVAASSPTFTLVHHTLSSTSTNTTNPLTFTIPSTSSGNLLVVLGAGYGVGSPTTLSAVTDSASQTWTHCASCNPAAIVDNGGGYFQGVDVWYRLSTASGVTSVTTTWSAAPSITQQIDVFEISRTSGSWAYDSSNNASNANATSQAGAALTGLTGTDDYLLQVAGSKESGSQTFSISGGSWTVIDQGGANNGTMFAAWNGSTTSSPTNSTITLANSDTLPIASIAFK